MKKKIFLILIVFLHFFIFGWYAIGSNNLIIIKLKNLFSLELRNNLKNTIFYIPNIIQDNKNLNERILKLNSSINAGLNFNDEIFPTKDNWYGVRKYYLPYNTSYFPNKKKSYIFKKNNFFFVVFESGKIISFDKSDFDKNKLFFNNFNSNLEYEFIQNERDNFSKILDVKLFRQNLVVSLLHKENSNCYNLILAQSELKYVNKLDFKKIFKDKKCFSREKLLLQNVGKIAIIKNQMILRLEDKLQFINVVQNKIKLETNIKKKDKIFSNNDFMIKYFTQNNKFYFDIIDLKQKKNDHYKLIENINLKYKIKIDNKINKIFDIKKISEKDYKIYCLGNNKKKIFIYRINKEDSDAILINEIKIGKSPEVISDVVNLGNKNFLLTFIKDPSIGLLSSLNIK